MNQNQTTEDDYFDELRKQAAADALFHYSSLVMACIGNEIQPCDLRLYLMKEISGMPTTRLKNLTAITEANRAPLRLRYFEDQFQCM